MGIFLSEGRVENALYENVLTYLPQVAIENL